MPDTNQETVHKLIISSFLYRKDRLQDVKKLPESANDMAGAAQHVGMLFAGLIPFRDILKHNGYKKPSVAEIGNMTVVRHYDRALMPLRLIKPEAKINTICKLGMEAYDAYFETNGRPDVVYADDCLYAGMIARKLKAAYGLPYVVAERRVRQRGLVSTALLDLTREVLLGASAVTVLGPERYDQLQKYFGDLDVVQHAEVV